MTEFERLLTFPVGIRVRITFEGKPWGTGTISRHNVAFIYATDITRHDGTLADFAACLLEELEPINDGE